MGNGSNSGKWHCNYCGKGGQDLSRTTCSECGKELLIFGTIEGESSGASASSSVSGGSSGGGSGKGKKGLIIGIVVVVVFMLLMGIGIGGFMILKNIIDSDPDPVDPVITTQLTNPTDPIAPETTQPVVAQDLVFPDLTEFANGYADYCGSETNDDDIVFYEYEITAKNINLVIEEYMNCLVTDYKYEYASKSSKDEVDYYGFKYTGSADVEGFDYQLDNGTFYRGINLCVVVMPDEEEMGIKRYVCVAVKKGFEMDSPTSTSSYDGKTAYIPSFSSYAGVSADDYYMEEDEQVYEYYFSFEDVSENSYGDVIDSYFELLIDNYSFVFEEEYEASDTVLWIWISYDGEANVKNHSSTINDGKKMENYAIAAVLSLDYDTELAMLKIYYVPGLTEVDNGESFMYY